MSHIILHQENYQAGDVITGEIILNISKAAEVYGKVKVKLFYTGLTTNSIGELKPCKPGKHGLIHITKTPNCMIAETLVEISENQRTKVFTNGTYYFPFALPPLPIDCPFSFTVQDKEVSYLIQSKVEFESKPALLLEHLIFVLPFHDLNLNLAAQKLHQGKYAKIVGITIKKLKMQVTAPTGVAINESLPISLHIENQTNMAVTTIRSKLIQQWVISKDILVANECKAICEHVDAIHVAPHSFFHVTHFLVIKEDGCWVTCHNDYIQVQHVLCVELETSPDRHVLRCELPMIVGTVPILSHFEPLNVATPTAPPEEMRTEPSAPVAY